MRIDLNTLNVEPPDSGKPGRSGAAGPVSSAPAAEASGAAYSYDRAVGDLGQVQTLQAQALAQPEVRDARVQALQQAIGAGEYAVSAGQIADALTSEWSGAQA